MAKEKRNYELNEEEKKVIQRIDNLYYMKTILEKIEKLITEKKATWESAFNKIYDVLIEAQDEVRKILNNRQKKNKIKDVSQAMKSIAGNAFSNCIIYLFLKNKIEGNISQDIFITSKKSAIKGFENIATIKVGEETQKPDADIIIYTKKENGTINKCIILSLKTSLRERAGQTYKWKLLMEIATTKNPIKEKYNISYNVSEMPLICFATVNFYNEINNPQHRGMFKFFDKAFIAKEINDTFISPLSNLIDYIKEKLG
ncbi:MAG: BsaWI family type II restriction enzyme [Exilispira sp.]|jgi:type II restriction enzyme|nr:BsaWI family type II restriction enzyme [Exilispira sp.]